MNLKLKAALLTLCVMLGFVGLAFIISLFPIVALMISMISILPLIACLYLVIYGMIG